MLYRKDHYYTYAEIQSLLQVWAKTCPELMKLRTIGKTYEGRDIFLAELTAGGNASEKPGILINGNLHSKELIGSNAVLYALDYFLFGYGKIESVTRILQDKALYFIPRINADGAEICVSTPYTLRGSTRLFHEEEDGIYPADINGDGEILKMRIPSEKGNWKCDAQDDRLMVPRTEDDAEGVFYNVFQEGLIRGSQEGTLYDAKEPCDLDPNRQFPFDWSKDTIGYMGRECSGKYPLYECEVRHLADFIFAHENISTVIDEHSCGGAYISPMEFCQEHASPKKDADIFAAEGKQASDRTGYVSQQVFPPGVYGVAKGSYTTWLYYERGIAAWCNENWNNRQLVETVDSEHPLPYMTALMPPDDALALNRALLKWNDEQEESYFCEWMPFHHPQLGKVEIGGWKEKWIVDNPPKNLIEPECKKALQFILQCIEASPQLTAGNPEIIKKDDKKYISLALSNQGKFPISGTYQAEELNLATGLQGTVSIGNHTYPADAVPENLAGGETAILNFIIPAEISGEFLITVSSLRAGSICISGMI